MKKLNDLLIEKNIKIIELSKKTKIPIQTLRDLCNGKTKFINAKTKTTIRIAKELEMNIEDIIKYIET